VAYEGPTNGADSPSPNRNSKMTDEELLALIASYERASLGSQVAAGATISTTVYPSNAVMTTLEIDRYNALNAFLARPLGNEIENRSQVVIPVVRDTVMWMLPQLMRIFAAAKSVCRFDPENQADVAQAEAETTVVNHIFMQQNDGLLILHDQFWDALLMRNGYVEVYTKEEKQVSEERYTGLSEIELAALLQDKDDEKLEVIEQKEYSSDVPAPTLMQGQPAYSPTATFDIRIRRTAKVKRTCVECLPPEEMRVTPRARQGMEGIVFSMHQTAKARSDLLTDGYDRDCVLSAAAGRPNWLEIDALARNQVVDQLSVENPSDFAMQEIEVRKAIIKVDYDGDKIAELRRVVILGDKIAENEVIEETPFVSMSAVRMPHRHTGISVYDLVMDLQVIQTDLWRQGLDNLKIANNQRVAVDWQNVNMDDLLSSRPGGVVRGRGPPSTWIAPIVQPSNVVDQVIPALEYIDQMRSNRTGIGKGTMGLDADELQNVTKGGQLAAMSAASLILELIARLLAEGVKGIFLKIHSELMRHHDKPLEFEIAGKWITVDPSQWRRRSKVTPNVGLGSGNREEMRANVQILGQAQQMVAQMGLVGPKQGWELFKIICEALGFSTPERFAMDPASPEYAQHLQQMQQSQQMMPPAPQVQAAQIRAQTESQKQVNETQRAAMKLNAEMLHARQQLLQDQTQHVQTMNHEAIQGHADRQIQLNDQHLQILLALIKTFSAIEAAKAKSEAVGGAEVGADITAADRAIE
jgi:hypothetical protein